ncbi:glycosyltransferase family 4 protein [Bacteroidia bacterium]|nr:glycosyltransferase family 4 protein [Bacteroidia bacterium]
MKILQVSNRVPWPLNEGGTIGIYNYTRAFSELGHEVTLYCLDGIKHNTPVDEALEELGKYATVLIHPIDTDVVMEEALKHLLRNESYNVSRFYNSVFEQELRELLQNNTYDVVQLEGTFVGPYLPIIKTNHNGLVALRMHNVEYEIWERLAHNEKFFFKKIYLKKLAKQLKAYESDIIRQVDIVVTVTNDDAAKFKLLNPTGNYLTIPAGIDLREWQYSPSNSVDKWYHIGSMEWHANAEAVNWYLDDIHPLMLKGNNDYSFHLAGKGLNTEQFSNHRNIVLNDNVPRAFDFVKECDVCIVPLKSGSGIRLKILEAMAAGKLVVSTTIGAQGIDYIPRKHLLIADSPAEFRTIYDELKNGLIDYKAIISSARKLIENLYSTEVLATEQISNYSRIKK